jgi:hypothetical protein
MFNGVYMGFSVFVLSCVQVEALRRANHSSKESYRPKIDQEPEIAARAHKGCRAIEKKNYKNYNSIADLHNLQ